MSETVIAAPEQLIVGTRREYEHRLMMAPSATVVVDLADCTYIDSTGLGMLVTARKRLADAGKRLVIRNANDNLLTLFELTRLSTFLGLDGAA